jgi:prepilin-type N-terminal cleavage/methylation domain-containing protein/prepilin-type processing-associated H-X9-DG protein
MNCGQKPFRCSLRGFRNLQLREAGLGPRNSRASAFSLIELLAVAAILLILTTLYWGGTNKTSKAQQKQAACADNLAKLFIGMQIYANDNHGKFPTVASPRNPAEPLSLLVPKYTADTSMFICAGSGDAPPSSSQSLTNAKISYAYYMGQTGTDGSTPLITDAQVNTGPKQKGQPLFSSTGKPPGNNHQNLGGNIMFCDGHVDQSAPTSAFSLVTTQGVLLLNP